MTAREFKNSMKTLGWKYAEAAEHLGKSVGMIKQWAGGFKPVPDDVAHRLENISLAATEGAPPSEEDVLEAQAEKAPQEPPSALTEEVRKKLHQSSTLEEEVREELETRVKLLEAENQNLRIENSLLLKQVQRKADCPLPDFEVKPFDRIERRGEGPKSSLKGGFSSTKKKQKP